MCCRRLIGAKQVASAALCYLSGAPAAAGSAATCDPYRHPAITASISAV